MKLLTHSFADLLPSMSDVEYASLLEDIRANGQREPGILFQGKILDGRNRYKATQELKLPFKTEDFKGDEQGAQAIVLSKSIRRNLTASQKVAIAVNFKPYFQAQAAARKSANGGNKKAEKENAPTPTAEKGQWRDVAGRAFGVSGRSVFDLDKVRQADQRAFDDVLNGRKTVHQAKRIVQGNDKRKQLAAKAKLSPTTGDAEIIAGDCVAAMEAMPAKKFRLIFADPPYNIGVDYGHGKKADFLPRAEYLQNTAAWMAESHRLLTDDGALWVMICDEWAIDFGGILRDVGFVVRRWVKWYETFGNNCADNFNRTSRHVFYCIKAGNDFPVFNREAFTRESDRKAKYGDKRAAAGGKIWDDVWQIPRLVDNAPERIRGFPTQLPLALVTPIVLGCSDPGDAVFDPFTGSGTTTVACVTNGRKFVGTEKEKKFADMARIRVRAALADV